MCWSHRRMERFRFFLADCHSGDAGEAGIRRIGTQPFENWDRIRIVGARNLDQRPLDLRPMSVVTWK